MKLSSTVTGLSFSLTLALDGRAKELLAAGRDVINMAVGEPDFPTPMAARRAAAAKVESGDVRYTNAAGTPELRRALADHLAATRGVPYEPAEVAVCHSCKHALAAVLTALIEPGDEVLVPLPAWASYFELVRLTGAEPVLVPPTADHRPDLAALGAAAGERTRGILFNSPCNPSGYVWTRDEVAALAALAEERDLFLISDEIYRRLVYEGEPAVSPVSLDPAVRARTVIVDGASKAYAMTGYRIGFAAAPREVAAAVVRLNSQTTGAPNAVSQAAYEAVLTEEPPEVEEMAREFAARRTLLVERLAALGLEAPTPRGAFYAFPRVARYLDERGSVGFCEDLLESEELVLVPGSGFGMDEHVRLSYALSPESLERALGRFERFLEARGTRGS